MNVAEQRRWSLEPAEDATSSSSSRFWLAPTGGGGLPRNRLRGFDEQHVLATLVGVWGAMLGTREERASILHHFEKLSTDTTSWEIYDGAMEGLQGVVAVTRRRPELFRTIIDISTGSLPRRKPSFAFLDQSGPHDDE